MPATFFNILHHFAIIVNKIRQFFRETNCIVSTFRMLFTDDFQRSLPSELFQLPVANILNRQISRQNFKGGRCYFMARKGENIYKRKDGRWEGRYIKGRKLNGALQYGYVYAYKYSEVKRRLLPLKCLHAREEMGDFEFSGSLNDWTAHWLEEIMRPKIKLSTYGFYLSQLNRHILPALGKRRLKSINRADIQDFKKTLAAKKLCNNSARGALNLLKRILDAAVSRGLLLVNPCQGVEMIKTERHKSQVLTREQQTRLESAAEEDENGFAVTLALYTGLRIGEISALKWTDVDFVSGTLTVRHTMQRVGNACAGGAKTNVLLTSPKSESSLRCIPLVPFLNQRLKLEKARAKTEFVIPCAGGFAEPRVIRYRYGRLMQKAGLNGLCFHSLRHSFATRCIEQGMDIPTLSQLLGHSSMKMTLDIYAHVTDKHKVEEMRKLEALHGGSEIKRVI